MKYFFDKWNDFARAIKDKRKILLLFDFDGTLAPIVGEPKKARLSPSVRGYLRKLSKNRRIVIGIVRISCAWLALKEYITRETMALR